MKNVLNIPYAQSTNAITAATIETAPTEYMLTRHSIDHSRINPTPNSKSPSYAIPKPATKKDNTNAIIILAIISQPCGDDLRQPNI